MGNAQASETKQVLAAYTEVINNTVINVYNEAFSSCTAINNLQFQTGGNDCYFSFVNGTLTYPQNAQTVCEFSSSSIVSANQQFSSQLKTNTENFINKELENTQGFLATAFSLQISGVENTTQLTDIISNAFTGDFTNKCQAVNSAVNNSIIRLCGVYENTNVFFDQNAKVSAMTSCVNDVLLNLFSTNVLLKDMVARTDEKLSSEQGGIAELIEAYAIYIIAFLVVILVLGWLAYRFLSNPDNAQSITTIAGVQK